MRHIFVSGCFFASLLTPPFVGTALATEGGNSHFPVGIDTATPALKPPEGESVWLNYTQFYLSDSIPGADGKSSVPGFRARVFVEGPRILHTWRFSLSGWNLTSGIVTPFTHKEVAAGGHYKSAWEFNDLILQPVELTRAFGDLHVEFGANIFVPTGQYDKTDNASGGLNYLSVGPEATLTWLPGTRTEVNFHISSDFVTETNRATNYRSGNSVEMDYSANYRPFSALHGFQMGVNGYGFAQWSNDTISGQIYNNGNRGYEFAIGPQFRYDFSKYAVVLKYQNEVYSRNRSQGDKIWFQFAVPF